jgi:DNA-binding transcriptional LysR family regulator
MLTPAQVDGLLEGSISVGPLRPPVAADGLVVEVLRHEPLVALFPVTHPLATRNNLGLTDLRGEPFIGYPSSPPPPCTKPSSAPAGRPDSPQTSARRSPRPPAWSP